MVRTSFERALPEDRDSTPRALLGFALDIPDDTSSIREVVDEFSGALMATPIRHALKLEDPLLRGELEVRAAELFAIEMKLRRVLSIIYLHAYPDSDPYDLLEEENVQPMAKDRPKTEQMMKAAENQFFHLTFGQYVGLNQRPPIKDLVVLIRNQSTYEALREELLRQPVEHEDDAGFLAGLKQRMDAIEKMRNAVAHNRRPTKRTTQDYLNALPLVDAALDQYLDSLEPHDWEEAERRAERANEPVENWRAKEVVRVALENAEWDKVNRTVRMTSDSGVVTLVSTKEALESLLCQKCSEEWHGHAMKIDGEYVGTCDEATWVSEALENYGERLAKVFPGQE